jgi:hypothetical protein
MPYADPDRKKEYANAYYKRKFACECGKTKHPDSATCRSCYDVSRRASEHRGKQGSEDGYTTCPTCNGRMSVHRAQCVACTSGQQSGSRRVGGGRGKTIQAYFACPPTANINGDTLVFCWYWKHKRLNILAPNLGTTQKYIKEFYKGMPREVAGSVCRISAINVNLTDIDLSQYNGAIP